MSCCKFISGSTGISFYVEWEWDNIFMVRWASKASPRYREERHRNCTISTIWGEIPRWRTAVASVKETETTGKCGFYYSAGVYVILRGGETTLNYYSGTNKLLREKMFTSVFRHSSGIPGNLIRIRRSFMRILMNFRRFLRNFIRILRNCIRIPRNFVSSHKFCWNS